MVLLSSLAEQMALVLENARLEAALARQRQESEELARVARLVSERLDVAAAGQRIADSVLGLLGVHSSAIRLLRADGRLSAIALGGRARDYGATGDFVPAGIGLVGRAFVEGRPMWTADIRTDERFTVDPAIRERNTAVGIVAGLAVPLRVAGEVIGVLSVGSPAPRVFAEQRDRPPAGLRRPGRHRAQHGPDAGGGGQAGRAPPAPARDRPRHHHRDRAGGHRGGGPLAPAGPARRPARHREPVRLGGRGGRVAGRRRPPPDARGPRRPLSAALRGGPGGPPARRGPGDRRRHPAARPGDRRPPRLRRPRVHGGADGRRRPADRIGQLRRRAVAFPGRAGRHRPGSGDPARDRDRAGAAARAGEAARGGARGPGRGAHPRARRGQPRARGLHATPCRTI